MTVSIQNACLWCICLWTILGMLADCHWTCVWKVVTANHVVLRALCWSILIWAWTLWKHFSKNLTLNHAEKFFYTIPRRTHANCLGCHKISRRWYLWSHYQWLFMKSWSMKVDNWTCFLSYVVFCLDAGPPEAKPKVQSDKYFSYKAEKALSSVCLNIQ